MSDAPAANTQFAPRVALGRWMPPQPRRMAVALALIVLAIFPGDLGAVTREMMVDAYFGVSVFVAATLLMFYGAERLFRFDLGDALNGARHWQVPIAALLGATPGCGGAVVVVAAYSAGHVRFGAVVATLTATMGDAAFLLIATRPEAAAVVLPLSLGVGILFGWLIDLLVRDGLDATPTPACDLAPRIGQTRPRDLAYLLLAAPGLAIGAAGLFQVEIEALAGIPTDWLALGGIGLGLVIWAVSPLRAMSHGADSPTTRMAEETSFISVWVIGAFLLYEYAVVFLGLDLEAMFSTIAPLLPLIAIVIGFVPGCGPQVLVTTLYINGVVPFSALIGNAISNDGDALFPAIALNPRAAVLATVYSSVPALIVAYGFFLLAPDFMN